MSRFDGKRTLEDRLEQNILFPFADYKKLNQWVYAKLLENGLMHYTAVSEAAAKTKKYNDCELIREHRDLPRSDMNALAEGNLPLEVFLDHLKREWFNLDFLHKAPEYNIQLGNLENYESEAVIIAPPFNSDLERKLAGIDQRTRARGHRRKTALNMQRLAQLASQTTGNDKNPEYLRIHSEWVPKSIPDTKNLSPEEYQKAILQCERAEIYLPRSAVVQALARGLEPAWIFVEYQGKGRNPYMVVLNNERVLEPEVTERSGLLIPAPGDNFLGDGGMAEVYKMINLTGFKTASLGEDDNKKGPEDSKTPPTMKLSEFSYVAKKIPNKDFLKNFKNTAIEVFQIEGKNARKLRHLPHTARLNLEDFSHDPAHPIPVATYSEVLKGEFEDFIELTEKRFEKDPKFGKDRPYSPYVATMFSALDHCYRSLVALAIANHAHGDIKPPNEMMTLRKNHSFQRLLQGKRRPRTADLRNELVDKRVLEYVQRPLIYDKDILVKIDLQAVRDENEPIDGMNQRPIYSGPYVDLKWFALGGRANHYTDMYATGVMFMELLQRHIDENFTEELKQKHQNLNKAMLETKIIWNIYMSGGYQRPDSQDPPNIPTVWRNFLDIGLKSGISPPFASTVDENGYERLFPDWQPEYQQEYVAKVEPTLLWVQYRNRQWPRIVDEMNNRGIVHVHPHLTQAITSMITDPYARECLDPETPKERQVVPQILDEFHKYMDS